MGLVACCAFLTGLDLGQAAAIIATDGINLNGYYLFTDSFDSGDPNHCSNGYYPILQPWKASAYGHVWTSALLNPFTNSVYIQGTIRSAAEGQLSIGPLGSVGDKPWVETGMKGIQPGHWTTDFTNITFLPVVLPEATWLQPAESNTNVDGTTYQYVVTAGGNYVLNLSGSLLVDAPNNALVQLWLPSSVSLFNDAVIRLSNTGAKLRIYMSGETMSLGRIDNATMHAENLTLFGMTTCTNIELATGNFYGVIYAPSTALRMGKGGMRIMILLAAVSLNR